MNKYKVQKSKHFKLPKAIDTELANADYEENQSQIFI